MLYFFQSMHIAVPRVFRDHRRFVIAGFLVAALGIFFAVTQLHAGGPVDAVVNGVALAIGWLLQQVIEFLGAMVILLVDFLIKAAQYNNFVNASIVITGWTLVRDVVNMFFIVVLLVVAFATIISYPQDFHYKRVLPKLLVMAVLINFSRTLVGVLIDFSQVIMLTFVNGFQAAAGGNFIKALKLEKITALSDTLAEARTRGDIGQTLGHLLIGSLLGIMMLSWSLTIILILLIYMLVRIVGLWLLLIFSPIAFFTLALPDKLGKSLSAFSGEWWSRLSAFLTGGPIVAFFLWLSLATIQGDTSAFADIYTPSSDPNTGAIIEGVGITKAGEAPEIASFIVASIMLLYGVQEAVRVASAAAPKLGALAQKIKSTGGPAVWSGRALYRGGAYVGAKGAGAIDKRADISGRFGRLATTSAAQGGMLGRIVGRERLARAGAKLQGIGAARTTERRGAFEKEIKHLSASEQVKAWQAFGKGRVFQTSKEVAQGAASAAKLVTTPDGRAGIYGDHEGVLMKQMLQARGLQKPEDLTENDRQLVKAHAEELALRDARGIVQQGMDAAKKYKMADVEKDLKEAMKKTPGLYSDLSSINDLFAEDASGKGIQAKEWGRRPVLMAWAKNNGLWDERTNTMVGGYKNTEVYKKAVRSGGDKGRLIEAGTNQLEKDLPESLAISKAFAKLPLTDPEKELIEKTPVNKLTPDRRHMISAFPGDASIATIEQAVNAPRQMSNFIEFTSNLSPVEKTTFQTSLNAAGIADHDAFAQKFVGRPLTAPQAAQIGSISDVYSGAVPPQTGWTPVQIGIMKDLNADGLSSIGVFGHDMAGVYARTQDQFAHNMAIQQSVSELANPNVNVQRKAIGMLANTDADAVAEGGAVFETLASNLHGNVTAFADTIRLLKDEEFKKGVALVKAVNKGIEKKLSAIPSSQPLNAVQQQLDRLQKQLQTDPRTKKILQSKLVP